MQNAERRMQNEKPDCLSFCILHSAFRIGNMAEGKWISDLKPGSPLAEAARHVLFVRLQVVKDCLPRAALEADRDIEYVHQLRVGTRRADAALRIFKVCLPKKVQGEARRRLRKLRRAAGAARDWDV